MMVQALFDLRGVWLGWHAQGLLEHSHCFTGGTLISAFDGLTRSVVLPLDARSGAWILLEAMPAR